MKRASFIFTVFSLLLIGSCQKVIDIKVSDTEPKLVIEANYNATEERVEVKVTKTVNVFSADNYPAVDDAVVTIISEDGVATSLAFQGDGIYLLENYTPVFESTYQLTVAYDGVVYTGEDYLKTMTPLDSLSLRYQEQSLFMPEGYMVFMNFQDPEGVKNYYHSSHTVNSEYFEKVGDQMLISDGLSDGKYYSLPIYWKNFELGDTISIHLRSYSQKTYKYYSDLYSAMSGTEMSAAPSNPIIQWANDTDEKIQVLGHFRAYTIDTKSIIVEEQEGE